MNEAIIGLGSNIEPETNISKAKELIARELKLIKLSKFVETEPLGFKEQDNFLNGAVLVNTKLDLQELNKLLKKMEKTIGRKKTKNKHGPRIIDLDILTWNGEIIDVEVYTRSFLRNSILELKPELVNF